MQITRSETVLSSAAHLTADHLSRESLCGVFYVHQFIDIVIIFLLLRSFHSLRSAEEDLYFSKIPYMLYLYVYLCFSCSKREFA